MIGMNVATTRMLSRMAVKTAESPRIKARNSTRLVPAKAESPSAIRSVTPTYLSVPTEAKSMRKNASVHQSTRFSTNSLAFTPSRKRQTPAMRNGNPKSSVFFGSSHICSAWWWKTSPKMVMRKMMPATWNCFLSYFPSSIALSFARLTPLATSSRGPRNQILQMKMVNARQAREIGVAHRRKSTKLKPARMAISTPIGLPTTVALEPTFVARTIISTYG